ncbi:MAG: hypothetical protein WDO73_14030 [Ignavibacteriota bacterium]
MKAGTVDTSRIYLAGRGDATRLVFYAISRMPDRWAAGIAVGGSPKGAIDTNRIFAINFTNTPVLWASTGANDSEYAKRLKLAGLNLEWRPSSELKQSRRAGMAGRPRAGRVPAHGGLRDEFADLRELLLGAAYQVRPCGAQRRGADDTDPRRLRDVARSGRIRLSRRRSRPRCQGRLPAGKVSGTAQSGPLKVGDVLEALDGKPIDTARQLMQILEKVDATRNAVVMVRRAKDRIRVETRIVVPRREPVVSARVKAEYMPEYHQIVLISRAVTEMRVTVPEAWIPGDLLWNGLTLENVKSPGCYLLKLEKELLHAGPCQ